MVIFDDFGDIPSAPQDVQDGIRKIVEERHAHLYEGMVLFQSDGYKPHPWGHPGIGKSYTFDVKDDPKPIYRTIQGLELIDPDKGLPEWQKRRNASQRAKVKLLARFKKEK